MSEEKMSDKCPKCGAELHLMHEIDGSKDCLRNQISQRDAKIREKDALIHKQGDDIQTLYEGLKANERRRSDDETAMEFRQTSFERNQSVALSTAHAELAEARKRIDQLERQVERLLYKGT